MSIKLNPAKPTKAAVEPVKVADPIPGLTTEQDTIVAVADEAQMTLNGGSDVAEPVVAPTVKEVAPASTSGVAFALNERCPSDWVITPVADKIEARNNKTGKLFIGTIKEFNTLIRN